MDYEAKFLVQRDQVPFSGDPLCTVPLQFPLQLLNENLRQVVIHVCLLEETP